MSTNRNPAAPSAGRIALRKAIWFAAWMAGGPIALALPFAPVAYAGWAFGSPWVLLGVFPAIFVQRGALVSVARLHGDSHVRW